MNAAVACCRMLTRESDSGCIYGHSQRHRHQQISCGIRIKPHTVCEIQPCTRSHQCPRHAQPHADFNVQHAYIQLFHFLRYSLTSPFP